jgi:hypothetical protein|tara:strand:- start:326 stop:544 length:219 start_codon:yes stop_codon:yes gene_type:complete
MANQEIFSLLYEIIDRLERIEKMVDFEGDFENIPEDVEEVMEKVFNKKPKLSVVRNDEENITNNVVEFEKND